MVSAQHSSIAAQTAFQLVFSLTTPLVLFQSCCGAVAATRTAAASRQATVVGPLGHYHPLPPSPLPVVCHFLHPCSMPSATPASHWHPLFGLPPCVLLLTPPKWNIPSKSNTVPASPAIFNPARAWRGPSNAQTVFPLQSLTGMQSAAAATAPKPVATYCGCVLLTCRSCQARRIGQHVLSQSSSFCHLLAGGGIDRKVAIFLWGDGGGKPKGPSFSHTVHLFALQSCDHIPCQDTTLDKPDLVFNRVATRNGLFAASVLLQRRCQWISIQ